MADSQPNTTFATNLYKAFFDDATLSDLTIRLSDRTVRVHRIVLCRQSEYFTKLLTGKFQESGLKEVELKEDHPDSMVALLRHIYDLPYDETWGDRRDQLHPHSKAYVVADKYQVKGLKLAAANKMKCIVESCMDLGKKESKDSIRDFLHALRDILTCTSTSNNLTRKVMVEACTLNLQFLRQEPALLSHLRESADLGAEIVGRQHSECGPPGYWACEGDCDSEGEFVAECQHCEHIFSKEYYRRKRGDTVWTCESCQRGGLPFCPFCSEFIYWERREL